MLYYLLVVDDRPAQPDGLRAWVRASPDFEILGHAATTQAALKALSITTPDLVLADAALADGVELVARIREAHPGVPVLLASPRNDAGHAVDALRAGAHGFVCVNGSPDAIRDAIGSVLAGHVVLPASALAHLMAPPSQHSSQKAVVASLSRRQLDVLRWIGRGLTTTEIADELDISPKTVETHRVHIKRKLGLDTANALIRWAALWLESDGRGAR